MNSYLYVIYAFISWLLAIIFQDVQIFFSEFSGISMIFYDIPGIPRHLSHIYTRITLGKTKGECELHNKFIEKWWEEWRIT